jgi:fatty acid desaturase
MSLSPPSELVEDLDRALDAAPDERVRRGDAPAALLGRPTIGRLLRLAFEDWAVIVAAWVAMQWTPAWSYPLWVLVVAGRIHALGIILHDACHMPIRAKTAPVRLLEALAGYPLGTTLDAMRYHHIRHHRDSGMPSDPYFKAGLEGRPWLWALQWLRGALLLPFWSVRPTFGLLSLAVPGLRHAYGRAFLQDKSGQNVAGSREVLRCAREELGQLVFQGVVLAAWLRYPDLVLRCYLIPAWLTGLLASYRLLMEHRYTPVTDRRAETILATTRDHDLGLWKRLFVAPRNIGYHIAHHLHPQVSLEHLPALTAWYREHHPDLYPEGAS